MPSIADGEFLIRNLWLSCDPAQRPWMEVDTYIPKLPLGEVMLSGSAGEVVESKHPDFAAGELVSGVFGWQDYAVSDGTAGVFPVTKVPPGVDLPTAMSLLGVPGLTAHIGLLEIGQPQPGDTVVVSGAAGSVGSSSDRQAPGLSRAGHRRRCRRATGSRASSARTRRSTTRARTSRPASASSPDGVDVFFDNVGGEILDAVLEHIAIGARIVLCGSISGYNDFEQRPESATTTG